jgi:hypothetical protein
MSLLESSVVVKVDKAVAQDALREYRKHRAAATAEDQAIMTAYREIARGRVVVQAIESIRVAGWREEGMPVLAFTRADVRRCVCDPREDGATFFGDRRGYQRARIAVDRMPQRPKIANPWRNGVATVPLIPLHLRPKAELTNYWILWEADWQRAPADPLLLRRLQGDLWIVLAAWELTAVERAVLEQRVNA